MGKVFVRGKKRNQIKIKFVSIKYPYSFVRGEKACLAFYIYRMIKYSGDGKFSNKRFGKDFINSKFLWVPFCCCNVKRIILIMPCTVFTTESFGVGKIFPAFFFKFNFKNSAEINLKNLLAAVHIVVIK